jgi:hypothetical protein
MSIHSRRAPWLLLIAVPLAVVAAACGGSDADADAQSAEVSDLLAPAIVVDPEPVPPFVSDPDLAQLVTAEALDLPARFVAVERDDREPILSLGLVDSAARVTYSSASTREILSFDLLRLGEGVSAETFFSAFADALLDNTNFQGISTIGVPRGIGERARRYAFSVGGDDAESAAILRDGVVALITHRRPLGLRQPLDLGALMEQLDRVLQGES